MCGGWCDVAVGSPGRGARCPRGGAPIRRRDHWSLGAPCRRGGPGRRPVAQRPRPARARPDVPGRVGCDDRPRLTDHGADRSGAPDVRPGDAAHAGRHGRATRRGLRADRAREGPRRPSDPGSTRRPERDPARAGRLAPDVPDRAGRHDDRRVRARNCGSVIGPVRRHRVAGYAGHHRDPLPPRPDRDRLPAHHRCRDRSPRPAPSKGTGM